MQENLSNLSAGLSNLIKKLINDGKLREKKVGFVQVESLLKESILNLKEAKKISDLAERCHYFQRKNSNIKQNEKTYIKKSFKIN